MRKTIFGLLAVAVLALSTVSPASAGHKWKHKHVAKPVAIGAVVGTVFGVGLYNGWWGAQTFAPLGATVGGSITGGLLVGIGTAATIHAVTTPCQGTHALFMGAGCKNGKYVGKHRHVHLFW